MPKPWPYNRIREPRPADWGLGMTICVAAIVLDEGIICASDTMLSTDDMQADLRTMKFRSVGSSWMVMFAGNDISPIMPILELVDEQIRTDTEQKASGVAGYFASAYKTELNKKAENEVLGPLGLSLEEFRTRGLKQLGPDVFNRLLYDIQNIHFSLDFMICGYDSEGPHILTVTNPGTINYYDLASFWAIGSGQTIALGHLFNLSGTPRYKSLPHALYCVCEAKFKAESAPGVGKETHATVIRPDGGRFGVYAVHMGEIREAWQKSRIPDVPLDFMSRVVDLVQEAEHKDKETATTRSVSEMSTQEP